MYPWGRVCGLWCGVFRRAKRENSLLFFFFFFLFSQHRDVACMQDMVQRVLQLATEESDDPDLRDRGFVYWRLLSTNPEAAKAVVLSEKPNIADDTFTLEPAVLDMLIGQVILFGGREDSRKFSGWGGGCR